MLPYMSQYFSLNRYFLSMHFLVFLSLALCSLSTTLSKEANENQRGLTIDLIHRDSPESPFYNPSLTQLERITNAALRSISRSDQVAHFLSENKLPQPIVMPGNTDYLIKFYVGTPPVERLALVYTASDLIWVQCSPCSRCFPQDTPLYDPTKSSTYKNLSCDSQSCNLLPPSERTCDVGGKCMYLTEYGDTERYSVGVLGNESIHFGSTDGSQPLTFANTIIGCGNDNISPSLFPEGKVTGVVGLGPGPLSLVSQIGNQIGHKFSYCLNNYGSSKMKFGNEAIVTGNGVVTTPLTIKPSLPAYYFINLESITFGKKVVQTGQTGGNIIIDTGALFTMLDRSIYVNFVASVKEVIGDKGTENPPFPFDFCVQFPPYDIEWPTMSMQFAGGNIPLKPRNLFIKIEQIHKLCLAVIPSPVSGISILGHIALIDIHVGFDIAGKKVSLVPGNCTHPS